MAIGDFALEYGFCSCSLLSKLSDVTGQLRYLHWFAEVNLLFVARNVVI